MAEAPGKPRDYSETYVVEQISTEFTVVKNGMRFPGSVVTRDLQYRVVGGERSRQHRERLLRRVEQTYQDYRFFGVRTEEEIKGVLGGRREPGSP